MRHSIAVAERAWLVAQREGVYICPSEMKLLGPTLFILDFLSSIHDYAQNCCREGCGEVAEGLSYKTTLESDIDDVLATTGV